MKLPRRSFLSLLGLAPAAAALAKAADDPEPVTLEITGNAELPNMDAPAFVKYGGETLPVPPRPTPPGRMKPLPSDAEGIYHATREAAAKALEGMPRMPSPLPGPRCLCGHFEWCEKCSTVDKPAGDRPKTYADYERTIPIPREVLGPIGEPVYMREDGTVTFDPVGPMVGTCIYADADFIEIANRLSFTDATFYRYPRTLEAAATLDEDEDDTDPEHDDWG